MNATFDKQAARSEMGARFIDLSDLLASTIQSVVTGQNGSSRRSFPSSTRLCRRKRIVDG